MERGGWIDAMRWDAMRRGGRAAGQTREPVRMPTELKPAVWGTSSMSHLLTGSLGELVTAGAGAPIGRGGPCQPGAPEAVPHGSHSPCSRCEPHPNAMLMLLLLLLQASQGLASVGQESVCRCYPTTRNTISSVAVFPSPLLTCDIYTISSTSQVPAVPLPCTAVGRLLLPQTGPA